MRFKGFVGPAYRSQSPVTDAEELINFFVERSESPGATAPQSLLPTPGFEAFTTVTETIGWRCLFSGNTTTAFALVNTGRVFGVCGNRFVEIFQDGTYTIHGTVATNANPATISSNGPSGGQLFITSGSRGYNFDLNTDTLTEVPDLVADQGGMLYARFVAFDKANSRFRASDLDGVTWDPTVFFERTIGSDPWQGMFVTPYGAICLPGTQTGEFWYNTGDSRIFAPDPSGLFAYGIAATFSITQSNNQTVWLSQGIDGGYSVMAAAGFRPQRISTHAVELAIAGYPRVDDAIGQTYSDQGHTFYLLTFPTADVTWAYDFSTQQWAKRGVWITEENEYTHSRAIFHCFAFGKHLMGDIETNIVYEMSSNLPMDVDGRVIRRVRRTPSVMDEMQWVFHDKLQVLVQAGLGNQSLPAVNPIVMMRYSDDFGQTWSNERQCASGRVGRYGREVYWWSLGMSKGRVYEVAFTDPIVNWRVTDAFLWARRSQRMAG